MAKNKTPIAQKKKKVETLTHEKAKRLNIPTAEYQSVMRTEELSPVRVAYERRNRDLDPQLVWRGKDEQDWSDLVVPAPPLYIQEKIHSKVLIDDLQRRSEANAKASDPQIDLFANFNGLPSEAAKTEFYQHDAHWSNRMILGDSLQVMASLAEREGLRGKVQCIYFDPPYGIKFNSNFQWSTTSRDVKDGDIEHITREPEQVKAFRDTWRDGIHSYLTYLRDRLAVARDLLSDSGSIFVQIGDENVHRVRALMDEVFGETNFVAQINVMKTATPSALLDDNFFYVLWYGKIREHTKNRPLLLDKPMAEWVSETRGGSWGLRFGPVDYRALLPSERDDPDTIPPGEVYALSKTNSAGPAANDRPFVFQGKSFTAGINAHWKTTSEGLERLVKADRLETRGGPPWMRKFHSDSPFKRMTNAWLDTSGKSSQRWYVVQTDTPVVRARIMGARYAYYLLADSRDGQLKEAEITGKAPSEMPTHNDIRQGFVYERVPHIMLSSIADNTEIDVIWDEYQTKLEPLRLELNNTLKANWDAWEIPRVEDEKWPTQAKELHAEWWKERIARQRAMDASIAAKAEFEKLFDRPFEDKKKVRVAGPFTVESLSPHRVLVVGDDDEFLHKSGTFSGDKDDEADFVEMILENLRTSGVQQAHKEDKLTFSSITAWPGYYVCAEGKYTEANGKPGAEKRAAIFIGPEFGTVSRLDLVSAAKEAGDAGFDVLVTCAFNYDAHSSDFNKLGKIPVLKARMNADLHMSEELKNTGKGNLFVIFGEPDIEILKTKDGQIQVKIIGVDVFHPTTGEVRSDGAEGIACWFVDSDYNEESFFVRQAYFLGANDPYKALKTTLKAEINEEAWASLHSDTSRPFDKPKSGRIAVKVINHLGDEVMKVFKV
jgi:adenine-specific DNA-methyltransferase